MVNVFNNIDVHVTLMFNMLTSISSGYAILFISSTKNSEQTDGFTRLKKKYVLRLKWSIAFKNIA